MHPPARYSLVHALSSYLRQLDTRSSILHTNMGFPSLVGHRKILDWRLWRRVEDKSILSQQSMVFPELDWQLEAYPPDKRARRVRHYPWQQIRKSGNPFDRALWKVFLWESIAVGTGLLHSWMIPHESVSWSRVLMLVWMELPVVVGLSIIGISIESKLIDWASIAVVHAQLAKHPVDTDLYQELSHWADRVEQRRFSSFAERVIASVIHLHQSSLAKDM